MHRKPIREDYMIKHTAAAAVAAIVLALAPAAYAETNQAVSTMKPGEIRASKFLGTSVYDVQNRKIGSVKELLFDRSGRIDQAVVDVGTFLGMGGKLVAIGLNDIKTDNNRLTLDMSKEQLKAAPEFKYRETESTGSSMPNKGHLARPHQNR
jgi:hypothetical protein